MKSWRKTVNLLLGTLFLVLLLFLLFINGFYTLAVRRQARSVDQELLNLWTSSTETRLSAVQEHISEILLIIYNSAPVNPGAGPMPFDALRKTQTALENAQIISRDADCFYVFDSDSDWFLFQGSQAAGGRRLARLKAYVREHYDDRLTGVNQRDWTLVTVDGDLCLMKTVALGRYTAGALCDLRRFDLDSTLAFLGEESSFLLQDGETTWLAGGLDWREDLRKNREGDPAMDWGRILVYQDFPLISARVVLASRPDTLGGVWGWGLAILLISSAAIVILILRLMSILRRKVIRPTHTLLLAHQAISQGDVQYRIQEEAGSEEFATLYDSFNRMAVEIQSLRIEAYDRLIREQENKLQMVRAQIRPHFYLNAITTVSNMTYQNRLEDIRAFLQALARFMRYMLNIRSQWMTVREELDHIGSYIRMQQLRFPGSVNAVIDCEEEVKERKIPFLILFTLVENAFKHALNLYKPLELTITCRRLEEEGFSGFLLRVEDNGDGFPEDVLEEFESLPEGESLPAKEHLGLSNVRYTLQYFYQRGDLLSLSNGPGGARAEIRIPDEEEPHDASHL